MVKERIISLILIRNVIQYTLYGFILRPDFIHTTAKQCVFKSVHILYLHGGVT